MIHHRRNHAQSCSDRGGFTIAELLAASVLAVLLVTAVLSVLQTVTGRAAVYARESNHEFWHVRLQQQLAWDLTNSRSIRPVESGFELSGFAGRNFVSKTPMHCRSIVRYSVVEAAKQLCLMRSEIHPDALNLENQIQELVCLNISGVVIGAEGEQPAASEDNNIRIQVSEGDLPDQLHLELYSPSNSEPVFAHDFTLR